MKNPCNPVFSNQAEYKSFRAKFSIWNPSLKTLDGPDFKDDGEMISKIKGLEQAKRSKHGGLAAIPEAAGGSSLPKVDKTIKATSGSTAFQYN